MADTSDAVGTRVEANRGRQRELYGAPLGDRVHRLTGALGISQARLARTVGLSPAMLSQLASGRRVKIGDPTVLARLLLLDQRCHGLARPLAPVVVDALLAEVAKAHWQWTQGPGPSVGVHLAPRGGPGRDLPAVRGRPDRRGVPVGGTAADALRGVTDPARLAAAAAALGSSFPELAEVLRQAAGRPRSVRANGLGR